MNEAGSSTTGLDSVAGNLEHVNMHETNRQTLYIPGYHGGDNNAPILTRYHPGEERQAVKQYIQGNPHFSDWQSLHGTATRPTPRDLTNLARATMKPIRLWDQSATAANWPMSTYIPNPAQLTVSNAGTPVPNVGLGSQEAYNLWYNRKIGS